MAPGAQRPDAAVRARDEGIFEQPRDLDHPSGPIQSAKSVHRDVSVSEATAQLTDLVRRAEAGEEIVLTRHGRPAARIVAARPTRDPAARRVVLEQIAAAGPASRDLGPDAARSQDFLYDDDDGLPG